LLDRTQLDPGMNAEDGSTSLGMEGAVAEAPVKGWMRPVGWLSRAGQFLFTL